MIWIWQDYCVVMAIVGLGLNDKILHTIRFVWNQPSDKQSNWAYSLLAPNIQLRQGATESAKVALFLYVRVLVIVIDYRCVCIADAFTLSLHLSTYLDKEMIYFICFMLPKQHPLMTPRNNSKGFCIFQCTNSNTPNICFLFSSNDQWTINYHWFKKSYCTMKLSKKGKQWVASINLAHLGR